MLTALQNTLRRRRRALTWTAGVVGGGYMVYSYCKAKLQEIQERLAAERRAKDNLQKRFKQNQVDCLLTTLALLPVLGEQVLEAWNVELVTEKLKKARAGGQQSVLPAGLREDGAMADSMSSVLSATDLGSEESKAPSASPSASAQPPPMALDKKTKMELWNELKISTFTRTLSLLYLTSLLSFLTHIQLNVVGRFSYIASVVAMARDSPPGQALGVKEDERPESEDFGLGAFGKWLGVAGLSLEPPKDNESAASASSAREISSLTERRYLSFSWWLLQQSWKEVVARVHDAVVEVVGPTSLKRLMSFEDVGGMLDAIRQRVEGQGGQEVQELLGHLLPEGISDEVYLLDQAGLPLFQSDGPNHVSDRLDLDALGRIDPELRNLLNESHDLVDSDDGQYVFRKVLDASFEVLRGHLGPAYGITAATDGDAESEMKIQEIREPVELKLASLFPVVNRVGQLAVHANPNDFVEAIGDVKELQGFSAIIYSSFDKDRLGW